MSEFEKWFAEQEFYTNMRFIHGDALFAKDGDVYRVLPVQMTYQAWQTARYKTKDERIALTQEWHTKGWNARQEEIDQLKAEKGLQELEINQLAHANQEWQRLNSEKEKEIEKLKAEKAGLLRLAVRWRDQAKELCRVDDKYVIGSLLSCAEQLEEAVRGGHE